VGVRACVRVCVCSLGIQHAMRMCYIVMCGLSGCTLFFHIISKMERFLGKKKDIEHKMFVLVFLYNFCMKHFSY